MDPHNIIYETARARRRGDPQSYWWAVLRAGCRWALMWTTICGAATLLVKGTDSAGRPLNIPMFLGLAAAVGFGLGAVIASSGRAIYLHAGGLAIRQSAVTKVQIISRSDLRLLRSTGPGGVELRHGRDNELLTVLWPDEQSMLRLQKWYEAELR